MYIRIGYQCRKPFIKLFRIVTKLLLTRQWRRLKDTLPLIRILLYIRSIIVDVQISELVILMRHLMRLLPLDSIPHDSTGCLANLLVAVRRFLRLVLLVEELQYFLMTFVVLRETVD